MKASACFHQGILASAMIISLAVVSPMSYGQSFAQTPSQQYETNSPQHWLGQARQMMAEQRFEVAQQYIQLAESILQNQPRTDLAYTPEMARRQLKALMSPNTAQVIPSQPDRAPVVTASAPVVVPAPVVAPVQPSQQEFQSAASALLAARQALAVGDVETAAAQINSAKSLVKDFSNFGDSPQAVEQLLQKQNQLADMRAQADPDYNRQAAGFLLAQAKTLIKYKDVQTSRMLVEQAQQFQVTFTPELGDPQQLLKEINAIAGVTPEPVAQATDKKNALSLLSQAQLAIDQKRWSDASNLVNQAKAIGLADSDYDKDTLRPWQLELKIQNGQKSAVVQTASTDEVSSTQFDPNVTTADFIPSRDTTKNVTVAAALPVEATLSDAAQGAMTLFASGVNALNSNDHSRAGEFFRLAQQRPEELTPDAKMTIEKYNASSTMRDDNVKPAQAQSRSIDLNQVRNEQQAAFRKLQSSIYKERADAEKLLEKSPTQALAKLTAVRSRIASANLSPETQRPLLTLIERDITEIQAYIEENLSEIQNDEQNEKARDLVERRAQRRVDTDQQIAKLVDEYNGLIDERRFDEAGRIVQQAVDLAPHLEVVAVMEEKYRAERNYKEAVELKALRAEGVVSSIRAAERATVMMDEQTPLQFGPSDEWIEKTGPRLKRLENARYSSDAERNIWNTLRQTEVEGEYVGTLAEAMGQLSRQAAVNIVFDNVALDDANIQTDQLINVPLTNPVKLENALNIILGNARLTFSVENEVIKVTTPESKRGKTKAETYYIGDLVMPMQVRRNPMDMIWNNNPYQGQGLGNTVGGVMNVNGANPATIPAVGTTNTLAMAQQIGGGIPFGGAGSGQGSFGGGGPSFGNPAYGTLGGGQLGGITEADFTPLIELIQSTIQSDSWEDSGTGEGTIQAYPANLSLVVNNTQEVQDQIVDLLKKLRELNDVQIVIEVRFITLTDDFFERVGIDFDFSLNDSAPVGTDATADVQSQSIAVGRSPVANGGNLPASTSNLDLQFLQDGFNSVLPTFAGFDPGFAGNFGFAILSDIEVFFLIQASKGSTRSNVTNSPTVTMFNGQSATVTDGFQQPFVTSVTPVVGDFAVAHQPIITILPDGTTLNVAAVVSNDRRSVRMTLVPQFTQIGDVETFTFEGSTSTATATNSFLDDLLDINTPDASNDEIETTSTGVTVQLPVIATTSVSTVVSVPDGGTILLGGVKRMTETRNEAGLPFLSNIPYVNRLFKNVGIGRTTSNLMMMVTPRIIIQAEEEAKQIGETLSN